MALRDRALPAFLLCLLAVLVVSVLAVLAPDRNPSGDDGSIRAAIRFVELPSSPRGMRCVAATDDRERVVSVSCVKEQGY